MLVHCLILQKWILSSLQLELAFIDLECQQPYCEKFRKEKKKSRYWKSLKTQKCFQLILTYCAESEKTAEKNFEHVGARFALAALCASMQTARQETDCPPPGHPAETVISCSPGQARTQPASVDAATLFDAALRALADGAARLLQGMMGMAWNPARIPSHPNPFPTPPVTANCCGLSCTQLN